MSKNLYAVLGVSRDADDEELRSSFRRQSLQWHPATNQDRRSEARRRFLEVSAAFRTLSDAEIRRSYDAYLDSKDGVGGVDWSVGSDVGSEVGSDIGSDTADADIAASGIHCGERLFEFDSVCNESARVPKYWKAPLTSAACFWSDVASPIQAPRRRILSCPVRRQRDGADGTNAFRNEKRITAARTRRNRAYIHLGDRTLSADASLESRESFYADEEFLLNKDAGNNNNNNHGESVLEGAAEKVDDGGGGGGGCCRRFRIPEILSLVFFCCFLASIVTWNVEFSFWSK